MKPLELKPRVREARGFKGMALWLEAERAVREDPLRRVQLQDFARALEPALRKLSAEHRAAFLLYAAGCTKKSIGDALGCSEGTAMSRVFYARKRLQEMLAQHRNLEARCERFE